VLALASRRFFLPIPRLSLVDRTIACTAWLAPPAWFAPASMAEETPNTEAAPTAQQLV
jgi:hypothetical protein